MSHSQYLRDLLRPLGIYDLEAPFNGGELDAQGEALDRAMAALEEIQRESSLTTAESWGLEQVARLFLWLHCCASAGTALPSRQSTTPSWAAASPPKWRSWGPPRWRCPSPEWRESPLASGS